jgi:hypothetical protein
MSLTAAAARQVLRYKEIDKLHEEANRVLGKLKAESRSRRQRQKDRPPRAPGKTSEQRREERNARATEIRAAVFARAAGFCEWHGPESKCPPPEEWHHVIGGGLRRPMEREDTTTAICRVCHRLWENHDMDTMRAAKEWAIRLGFKDALREIERRIAKVKRMRTPSVPVRIETESA